MYNSLEPNLNLVAQIAEAAGIAADRSLVVGERAWRVVFSARPGSIYVEISIVWCPIWCWRAGSSSVC